MKITVKSFVLGVALFAMTTSTAFGVVSADKWANSALRNETAGMASFTGADGTVPANAITGAGGDATLADAFNYEFFVTSDAAPLVLEGVISLTKGTLFQHPAGTSDIGINTALFPFAAALEADTYFDLPGSTVSQSGANTMVGWDTTAPTLITGDPHIGADANASDRTGMGFVIGKSEPGLGSADDVGAMDYKFANITVMPDANGDVEGVFQGILQTRRTAATHNGTATPLFSGFEFDFGNGMVDPGGDGFEDGVDATAEDDTFHGLFGDGGTTPSQSLVNASDTGQNPNGVTLFVPSNAAMASFPGGGAQILVDNLLVADDGVATTGPTADSGTPGWSLSDLENMVSTGSKSLTTFANSVRVLEDGSVVYGGATVIESHQTGNGWVHITDAVPVPEPASAGLVLMAMVGGLLIIRKRR